MTAPSDPTVLFVYGTLMPGDVRWPLLERYVVDAGTPDRVRGHLFDTGLDYPAAIFDEAVSAWVLGRRYRLDPARLDEALEVLDIEEDTVAGLYRRAVVTTGSGITAWAYAYGTGLDLTPIPSGDWFNRPTR
ncbi:MAG: hypothetical protein RIR49_414 [Actinomycetota bacterium]|jgi:gamma-glutamylcyclotransferase (GGCT)/AIG2-like uncharacterized protein YtfP